MPDPETPPPPPPQHPQQSGPWWFRPFLSLFSMTPEQQRGAVALIYMTVFLMGGGWLVYYLITSSDRVENERMALLIRAFENEGERNRQDSEKGRQSVTEIGKLTIASHQKLAGELGKLELRLSDMHESNQDLKQQVQNLGSMIGKLEATIMELRKKLPPNEINLAPMPKLHDAVPLTAPVIG